MKSREIEGERGRESREGVERKGRVEREVKRRESDLDSEESVSDE